MVPLVALELGGATIRRRFFERFVRCRADGSERSQLFCGPQETTAHEFSGFRDVEHCAVMAQSAVEHATDAERLDPDRWHFARIVHVRTSVVRVGEIARRQDFVAWVGVQVILLARYFKVLEVARDLVVFANVDVIGHAIVAWMRDPLPAGHELPVGVATEGVAHSAVASCYSDAADHCRADRFALFGRDLAHRPNRHDQAEVAQLVFDESIKGVAEGHVKALLLKNLGKVSSHLFGLVPVPPAPNDQRFSVLHLAGLYAFRVASLLLWARLDKCQT